MSKKPNPYQKQKQQISSIVKRIDKKRSMQIFMQRSEGTLMQNQIQSQLKNIKKKCQKSKTFNFQNHYRNRIIPKRRIQTQNARSLQHCLTQEKVKNRKQSFFKQMEQKCQKQKINLKTVKNDKKMQAEKVKIVNNFRPQLEQYSKYQAVTDISVLKRRRRIIQMLILCLLRRCHKKLYEALDIAIQVSSCFEEDDTQIILKSICLTLMGKIYKEINLSIQKEKKIVKSQNSLRSKAKRHSSLMIKTLASQRAFFNRFTHKFKKSRLIKETSYKREEQLRTILQNSKKSQSAQNVMMRSDVLLQQNQRVKRPVLAQISSKLAVTFAHPSQVFSQYSTNYKIVIHQRDTQNNLFPYQYPSTLLGLIQKKEYITMVSNINGIIFPIANCYTMKSSLKLNFTSLIFIVVFLFLALVTIQNCSAADSNFNYLFTITIIGFLAVSCYFFIKENKNQAFLQIYQRLNRQLQKCEKRYEHINLKFRGTQGFQAFFICSEINDQDSNQSDSISDQEKDNINQEQNIGSGSIYCRQDTLKGLKTIKEHEFSQQKLSMKQSQGSIKSVKFEKREQTSKSQPIDEFQSESQDEIIYQRTNNSLNRNSNSNLNLDCFQFIQD